MRAKSLTFNAVLSEHTIDTSVLDLWCCLPCTLYIQRVYILRMSVHCCLLAVFSLVV